MGIRAFYLFGKLQTDINPSVYDNTDIHDRVRFYFCDTPNDLPINPGSDDLAIVKNTQKLMFVDSGVWVQIKGKD
jgi:hypothetical protein